MQFYITAAIDTVDQIIWTFFVVIAATVAKGFLQPWQGGQEIEIVINSFPNIGWAAHLLWDCSDVLHAAGFLVLVWTCNPATLETELQNGVGLPIAGGYMSKWVSCATIFNLAQRKKPD